MLKKFDFRVFILLIVLVMGIDYFNDPTLNQDDLISNTLASVLGTFIWGFMKEKMGM